MTCRRVLCSQDLDVCNLWIEVLVSITHRQSPSHARWLGSSKTFGAHATRGIKLLYEICIDSSPACAPPNLPALAALSSALTSSKAAPRRAAA